MKCPKCKQCSDIIVESLEERLIQTKYCRTTCSHCNQPVYEMKEESLDHIVSSTVTQHSLVTCDLCGHRGRFETFDTDGVKPDIKVEDVNEEA